MALTQAEQDELNQLQGHFNNAPVAPNAASTPQTSPTESKLSPDEEAELNQLQSHFASGAGGHKGDQIENEQAVPFFSDKGLDPTRMVYKNFGADKEASFNYLQKQHPELEWKLDADGEPIARARGATSYKRLDPKGLDWGDIGDIPYDVASGVAQGAASAAGGIAGATLAAPTVVGAIPGAMAGAGAASGMTAAGLEALRQKIGNLAGIDQKVNLSDVAKSGAIGAAAPLVLGSGGTAAAVAGKGLIGDAAESIANAQKGLIGRGYDAVAGYTGPKLAELVSDIPAVITKTAAKMLPDIAAADKNPDVLATPLRDAAEQVPKILKEKTRAEGQKLTDLRGVIDSTQTPGLMAAGEGVLSVPQGSIPSAGVVQPFMELVQNLTKTTTGTVGQKADLATLGKIIKNEIGDLPEKMTAAQADALDDRFKTLAKQYGFNYGKTGSTASALEGAGAYDSKIALAFEQARRNIRKGITERLQEINPTLAEDYGQIKDSYSALKEQAALHKSDFKNSKSVQGFLGRAVSNPVEEANLNELQNTTGYPLSELALKQKALKTFANPATDIRSSGGVTSTSRTVPLSIASGAAGYAAGQKTGFSPFIMSAIGAAGGAKLASPAALRKYMQMNSVMREAIPQSELYKMVPYTLMNLNNDKGRK